ncbi:hypothetical protein KXV99_004511, partial [Aspergillus fumigatus]
MAETRQGCSSCWPMVYVLLNTRAGERISAALAVGELCFSTTALQLSPLRRAFCSSNPPMFHLEDQHSIRSCNASRIVVALAQSDIMG